MNAQVSAAVFAQMASVAPIQAPANKPANKGSNKGASKGASKPANKGKQAPAIAQTKNVAKFGIKNGYRPVAGRTLFALTHAWLSATGLAAGGSVEKSKARAIAGSRAISYHSAAGRFETNKGMLSLTAAGQSFFSARRVDAKLTEEWVSVITKGAMSDAVGIKVKEALSPL